MSIIGDRPLYPEEFESLCEVARSRDALNQLDLIEGVNLGHPADAKSAPIVRRAIKNLHRRYSIPLQEANAGARSFWEMAREARESGGLDDMMPASKPDSKHSQPSE